MNENPLEFQFEPSVTFPKTSLAELRLGVKVRSAMQMATDAMTIKLAWIRTVQKADYILLTGANHMMNSCNHLVGNEQMMPIIMRMATETPTVCSAVLFSASYTSMHAAKKRERSLTAYKRTC